MSGTALGTHVLVALLGATYIIALRFALISESLWWRRLALVHLLTMIFGGGELAARGYLRDSVSLPPPLVFYIVPLTAFTIFIAFSRIGTRLNSRTPLWALVGFQSFRIGVEVLLWALHRDGQVPRQMTFEGWNFDILTGIAAVPLAFLLRSEKANVKLIWVFNVVGLLLLITIVTISVLSTPQLDVFAAHPPNEVVMTYPYVWIPSVFVQFALLGHLLVFRRLMAMSND